jgi:hypothetical protein
MEVGVMGELQVVDQLGRAERRPLDRCRWRWRRGCLVEPRHDGSCVEPGLSQGVGEWPLPAAAVVEPELVEEWC